MKRKNIFLYFFRKIEGKKGLGEEYYQKREVI